MSRWSYESGFRRAGAIGLMVGTMCCQADPLNHWTQRVSGISTETPGVVYAAGQFLAVGAQGSTLNSNNGVDWFHQCGAGNNTLKVFHGMKRFLILGGIFGGCVAAFLLSYLYISQPSVAAPNLSKRPPIDISALTAKAEHGDPQAQADLGDAYVSGDGVTNSYPEAAKWYRLAADQTNAAGQFGLGQLYEAGRGVPKDQTQAVKLYREAANQGLAAAQYTLGFLYEAGRGLSVNQTEAAKWYLKAAEQGDPLAQYDIGQRYDLGVGVAVDRVEGLKWFILAANQGQADSVARRDGVKSALSRAEIAEAERRANAISAKRSANHKN